MAYADPSRQRLYLKEHYARNKEAYRRRAREYTLVARRERRVLILDYLRDHPCVDCGESDPIVLEFDHRDPSQKLFEIGTASHRSFGLKKLVAEIAKCDVRCANCHRRKTYRERGHTHRTSPAVTNGPTSVSVRPAAAIQLDLMAGGLE